MKKWKFLRIIVLAAMIGVAMTNCDNGTNSDNGNGGTNSGNGGTNSGGDTTAPVLSAGSVNRSSATTATITFTTNKAGAAYYLVQNSGAATPAKTAVRAGIPLSMVVFGVNSNLIVTLTDGWAKDIYVVVEDASGNISSPLKIEAAALYSIGDTGPAGGIIFYVSAGGFAMTGIPGTCHYLEASPANLTGGTGSEATMRWSTATEPRRYPYIGATGDSIGSGKNNTAIIIAAESAAYPGNTYVYAARACSEYRGGGKDDWFLPSRYELNELYKAKGKTGIPTTGAFWSSSQLASNVYTVFPAWAQRFSDGLADGISKDSVTTSVRAIRAF
jgi:hypothetical protein